MKKLEGRFLYLFVTVDEHFPLTKHIQSGQSYSQHQNAIWVSPSMEEHMLSFLVTCVVFFLQLRSSYSLAVSSTDFCLVPSGFLRRNSLAFQLLHGTIMSLLNSTMSSWLDRMKVGWLPAAQKLCLATMNTLGICISPT